MMIYFVAVSVLAAVIALGVLLLREPPIKPGELYGVIAVITGASTGIGEQIAYEYARAGAQVFLIARRKHALEEVAKRCLELGAKAAVTFSADMGSIDDINRIPQEVESSFAGSAVYHLILNHKIENEIGPWSGTEQNMAELEKVMNVNFYGCVRVASVMMQLLEKSHGSVGVISSASGRSNSPYLISYSASKHALDGFFGGWRLELAARKSPVTITYCTLGLIETPNMRKETATFAFENFQSMGAASSTDTAQAIVIALARRRRELYFPYLETKIPIMFSFWFPETLDMLTGYFLKAKRE